MHMCIYLRCGSASQAAAWSRAPSILVGGGFVKLRETFWTVLFILILQNYEELRLLIDYIRCLGSSIHAKIVNFDNFEFFLCF